MQNPELINEIQKVFDEISKADLDAIVSEFASLYLTKKDLQELFYEDKELDAIYDALPDWKEEADFKVVAVSTDDSRLLAKAKSFAEGRGWGEDYVLLFDKNQDFMRAMNVSVVPHVFVLDAKGKIVYSHTSYVPGNELELFEAIKKSQK